MLEYINIANNYNLELEELLNNLHMLKSFVASAVIIGEVAVDFFKDNKNLEQALMFDCEIQFFDSRSFVPS